VIRRQIGFALGIPFFWWIKGIWPYQRELGKIVMYSIPAAADRLAGEENRYQTRLERRT